MVMVNFGSLNIQDSSVEIFNANGARIMNQKTGSVEMQMDLSTREKGVYLLIFKSSNLIVSKKIVVR
ncbi:MAG: T9SS type A sorting domain-containing protein [Bacteroidetes bacterium]|nr:T9SS type A sorting domain-containing protein [Bacteroidota bacterium]